MKIHWGIEIVHYGLLYLFDLFITQIGTYFKYALERKSYSIFLLLNLERLKNRFELRISPVYSINFS